MSATRFRLRAKRFFLTFPQCDVTKEVAAKNIEAKWLADIDAYAIAAETHAPTAEDPVGGPHLHVLIHFKKEISVSRADFFDCVTGTHGNYQVQKGTLAQAAEYLTKEDKEPKCFNIDLEAAKRKKSSKFMTIAKLIQEGKSIEEIDAEYPDVVMMHKRKLEDYVEMQKSKRARVEVPSPCWLTICGVDIPIGMPREHRATQYYIWGPPGIGKSTIIVELTNRGYRGFALPYNGHWEDWSDDDYDFAYADEFNGQVKITELNQFLSGDLMLLPCRFRNKMKRRNVTTLILSNLPLEDQYKNVPEVSKNALMTRLTVITSNDYLNPQITPQTPIPISTGTIQ
jgi:hypothetical protein